MSETLQITALGAQGDGVAETKAGPVYVPFALPGETVTAAVMKGRAYDVNVKARSPERAEPACRHFGACGGCAVQHLAPRAYAAWKRRKVMAALQSRGIEAEVGSLVTCPPASRRRVVFTARKLGQTVLLGFNAAQSHHILDIAQCPVASAGIVARLESLRELAGLLAATPRSFQMAVTETATGLDIAVAGAGVLGEKRRAQAVSFVMARGLARLVVDGETFVEREKPVVLFGGVPVAVPPGGFLQAVASAEEAMATLVTAHLEKCRSVADLFAGCGTFALRLAREARVHAVEGNAAALGALGEAARRSPGLKPVSTEKRDLFHRPLTAKELAAFDGLVFDPPRAGAEAECRQIARSRIARVAAVSCNPGTLARDLAILAEGGFEVRNVTPIDQFLWSPHVEAVALLERKQR